MTGWLKGLCILVPCRRESNLLVGLKGSLHVGVDGHKADSADGPEDRGKFDSGSKTEISLEHLLTLKD